MPIEFKSNLAIFQEVVSVDDADDLLRWLQNNPTGKINLSTCTHIHPANLQVLMAANANIAEWPDNKSLSGWLASALKLI